MINNMQLFLFKEFHIVEKNYNNNKIINLIIYPKLNL